MLRLACCVAAFAICINLPSVTYCMSLLVAGALYLITGGWKCIRILSKTFRRDFTSIGIFLYAMKQLLLLVLLKKDIRKRMDANARKQPNKKAFVDADTQKFLTFKQVDDLCHRIAKVYNAADFQRGDVVALLMENRIDYFPIWFGLSLLGVVPSLINNNLRGDSLKHCLDVCKCKAVIFSKDTMESIKEIQGDLAIELYCYDTFEEFPQTWKCLSELGNGVSDLSALPVVDFKSTDTFVYLYTSGTTGYPKAVVMTRMKGSAFCFFPRMLGFSGHDVLYNALPMYHANSFGFINLSFFNGATTIIKKKFSASQFMSDCCKYDVTVFNYIGEICRYILCQPTSECDRINNIRLAIGNGLKASIWKEFQDRFSIRDILEVYGATESNIAMMNMSGKIGAVGYHSKWFPFFNPPMKLVKMDSENGDILRDSRGLAIEAKIGEPGQAVGKITKMAKFDGYTNKEANAKKIARDIFSHGDSAFLSGDILIKDEEGYFYFQDRTGDTFRWKSENVSTNEVEGLISKVLQLTDVCVYGVEVPGNEGKAGMAYMMDPENTINVEDLPTKFDPILPRYAQPQFLRLSTKAADITGTFKFQKNALRKEAYNPETCGKEDRLFFFHKKEKKYVSLDMETYERILNQSISF